MATTLRERQQKEREADQVKAFRDETDRLRRQIVIEHVDEIYGAKIPRLAELSEPMRWAIYEALSDFFRSRDRAKTVIERLRRRVDELEGDLEKGHFHDTCGNIGSGAADVEAANAALIAHRDGANRVMRMAQCYCPALHSKRDNERRARRLAHDVAPTVLGAGWSIFELRRMTELTVPLRFKVDVLDGQLVGDAGVFETEFLAVKALATYCEAPL